MELENGRREIRFSSEEEEHDTNNHPTPAMVEKEHMFDKVVTPSDVGKLNRLVIPKQHAEKYFPLDAAANDSKGLLLNFEDRNGKPWRFRYSYWNSSQSYVMTKGWSRFVKEKRLDAGDTVSFGRGVGEAARDRLFIDWKRRPEVLLEPQRLLHHHQHPPLLNYNRFIPTVSLYEQHRRSFGSNFASTSSAGGGQYFYFPTVQSAPPLQSLPMVLDSVPVVHSPAVGKRVRLFGVNLDCPDSDSGDGSGDSVSPSSQLQSKLPHHLQLRLGGVDSSEWLP